MTTHEALTLGELYHRRDALRQSIDMHNGGVETRRDLLATNQEITKRERERMGDAKVCAPPLLRWKRRTVWI